MALLKEIADVQTGPFGSQLHKEDYVEVGTPIVTVEHLGNRIFTEQNLPMVSDEDKERLSKYILQEGDIVFSRVGSVDRCSYVDGAHDGWLFSGRCLRVRPNHNVDAEYLYYFFTKEETKQLIRSIAVGATMPSINTNILNNVEVQLPSLVIQRKIARVLSVIDKKIEVNNEINRNLSEQAFALFKEMFPNVNQGEHTLGEYLSAVKGKALLSKDAVEGDVPVIAGGLSPATYHNVANTKAPVLTISASGANAGYVALWNVDVWSSDSSYIDSNMTENVYFWYVMLKTRQKEIFDAHTGSVQPHIYPKNIDDLSVAELDRKIVTDYTMQVSPLFELIGKNIKENERLIILRDSLLPKLMSGDLNVSNLYI